MASKNKLKIKAILFPKPYSNGEYPVYIRIYYNRRTSYISTGYSIPSGAWNNDLQTVWESKPSLTIKLKESLSPEEYKTFRQKQRSIILLPNAIKINTDIRNTISELESILKKLEVEKALISADNIKELYEDQDKNENARKDFLQYIKQAAERKYQNKQIRTSDKYLVLYRKLKAFKKDKPLPISELDTAFLKDFVTFMKKEGSHQNYIHVILKALKTIIQKEAIKEDKIIPPDRNPFFFFTMPEILPTRKERLDEKEIEKIESLDLPESEILFHIKNAFLFSYFNAGIRIGDLLQLKWHNIEEGRIHYFMGKTGRLRSIKLLPQALKILNHYQGQMKQDADYIFPFLDNNAAYSKLNSPEDFQKASPELLAFLFKQVESKIVTVNKGLKMIAMKAGIKKRLTSHIARHSFADRARKKGNSIYDISKMLGHSKVSITEAYIESLDIDAMDNAMETVFK